MIEVLCFVVGTDDAGVGERPFFRTRTRDSTTVARRHARAARVAIATSAGRRSIVPGMTDPTIQRIESFQCRRGSLSAERRNGVTHFIVPTRHAGRAACAPPGRTIRSRCSFGHSGRNDGPTPAHSDAPRLIASEDIFWASR
jgi:hypothetical protein